MLVRSVPGRLMKLKYLFTLLMGFFLSSGVHASAGEDALWNKANHFYTQKQYDSAELYYTQLLRKYPENVSLQYNMGNTSFRLNKVGAAVLHYQKAALLEPGNKEIRDNLLLAKGRILNPLPEASPIFFVRWWYTFLQLLSANTWAIFAIIVFLSVLALVWYARIKKERFIHAGRWLSLSIVCLIICGCMAWFTYQATTESGLAVVLDPTANLVDSPKSAAKVLGNLPEGTVIEVYSEDGHFMNVKLPNGREGWILSSAVGRV